MVVLKPIDLIAPNWVPGLTGTALELSTLGCSSTHNNTLQVLQITALGSAPPKTGVIEPFFPHSHSPHHRKNGYRVIFPPYLDRRKKWLYSRYVHCSSCIAIFPGGTMARGEMALEHRHSVH